MTVSFDTQTLHSLSCNKNVWFLSKAVFVRIGFPQSFVDLMCTPLVIFLLIPCSSDLAEKLMPSASQKIPRTLWKPTVHYRIHKSPLVVTILSHIDSVHTSHPTTRRFILVLSSHLHPISAEWSWLGFLYCVNPMVSGMFWYGALSVLLLT